MTSASHDAFADGMNSEESSARVVSDRGGVQAASGRKSNGERLSDLMREVCSTGERRGVRVVSPQKRGHVFFDQGHVVHAEFGEDVGLRALLEMLRMSSLELQPCARPWPSQPSLFLSAEVVFAALGQAQPESLKVATEVRRRVQVVPERAAGDGASSARIGGPPRPVAGLPARVPAGLLAPQTVPERGVVTWSAPVVATGTARSRAEVRNDPPVAPTRAAGVAAPQNPPARVVLRGAATSPKAAAPSAAASSTSTPSASTQSAAAASGTAVLPVPAPLGSTLAAALALGSGSGVERTASLDPAAATSAPRVAPSRTGNVFWARPTPAPSDRVVRSEPSPHLAASRPVRTLAAGAEAPPTTMVRVSSRGVILAARGEQSERLADAAAFIHNQAKLIAADLGRHGRAAVHLRGGGLSLLVVKSEVNDVAAALGSTERLKSLLRKVGFG